MLVTAAALVSLVLFEGVQGQAPAAYNNTQVPSGFAPCDALIAANLDVSMPSEPDFNTLVNQHWSLNTRRAPWCFVRPGSPAEVAKTITTLRSVDETGGDWHVAMRSGGHGGDETNNIAQGVTIDLTYLNATTYDASTNVASIGTGARWLSVLDTLHKDGVVVPAGREGTVGVGGFTLGGGISWYTPRTGFACDSVVNYEVVLASGEMINANASANSDLWRALKGGGTNFGVVTRFDMEAIPSANVTMQQRTVSTEHMDEFIDALHTFLALDESWQDNAIQTLTGYSPQSGDITMTVIEINTANNLSTTAFDGFNAIPALSPSTKSSMTPAQVVNSSHLAPATLNAGIAITVANDARVLRYSVEQHANLVAELNSTLGPQGFSTSHDIQPIAGWLGGIGEQKGGNVLGLDRDSRNKVLMVTVGTVLGPNAEAHYPRVYQRVSAMAQRILAFAKSVGADEDFRFFNYADSNQNVLGSYGEANVERIKEAAKKFDPDGFFQQIVPGGFKIDRAVPVLK